MLARRGISSLISLVLIIGALMVSTLLVLNQATPAIERNRESSIIAEARQAISSIDQTIRELILESPGASRLVRVPLSGGNLIISTREDSIKFFMDTKVQMMDPGSISRQGNIIEAYGSGIRAVTGGLGSDTLILENEALRFEVLKIHNSTNPGNINTTATGSNSIIQKITNKRTGYTISNPIFGIYINNITNSSFGTGYTELTESGETLPEGAIVMNIQSNASIKYEVIFRLLPGQDFIESEVKLR